MARHECLNENDLFRLAEERMTDSEREALLAQSRECGACTAKLAGVFAIEEDIEGDLDALEAGMTHRAKDRVRTLIAAQRRKAAPLWKQLYFSAHVWFAACLVSIAASFVVRGYYKQFLVLSLVCGGKWLLESRSAKTQITVIRQDGAAQNDEPHRWKQRSGDGGSL